ncbi:MAG: response regulator, partial [Gemmatimonadota bacterium]|nr:response regulator [Gemmatimonadota bacterium]
WTERRETPLSHSFCQYTVARGEPLVIEDARVHPLVRENLAIPDLRVVARLVLERRGYRVREAADGEAALEVFHRHTGPVELLVADVLMPKPGGTELARRVHAVSPRTRVVLMSGYVEEVAGSSGAGGCCRRP